MYQLLVLLLVLVLVVFPLWALIRILALSRQNNAIAQQLYELEAQLRQLRERLPPPTQNILPHPSAPLPRKKELPPAVATPPVTPPLPLPATPTPVAAGSLANTRADEPAAPSASAPEPARSISAIPGTTPPPIPPYAPPAPLPGTPPPRGTIDWEQFMGAKLFAWLGGLAAFLGAAFFVKYSFEHDLIPPEVRVALAYAFALALVIGGLKIPRDRYAITAQTLCATGIVSLYAVTFACNALYAFPFFGTVATFALMTLITAAAFLLAVRLEARVVAVLGVLGGFLTPILLSTGRDNAVGLFGYVALLDLGLIAIALRRNWSLLVPLGAAGTVLMQLAWAARFLNVAKVPTAMGVALAFCGLFLAAYVISRAVFGRVDAGSADRTAAAAEADGAMAVSREVLWSAVVFPFVAFAFAAAFLGYPAVSARPGLLFSFVLAADLCLLALAWLDARLPRLHLVAGIAVFALLAIWTGTRLTADLLGWALGFYLVYAALHTAFPLVLERRRPAAAATWWSQLFPPLALLLMLGPLLKLEPAPLLLWPAVLLIDLIAVALALFTASLAAVAVVLVLTLGATALWLFRVPATLDAGPAVLPVVGGFAVLFFAAGIFLARKLGARLQDGGQTLPRVFGDRRAQIPAFSALLPFVLLVMMSARLPLPEPSNVFGLALLLVVLTLGLARLLAIEWLPACALGGVAALEYAWHARHFAPENAAVALGWYLGFLAVFAVYPFVFRRHFLALTGPWAVAALAGAVQFPLVYRVIDRAWPNDIMGLLPVLFAVPPLLSLAALLRTHALDERARLNQLAWYGGATLLFITLVFPIQFERQWITLGWALEGAALLWLFHRVPHPGLRALGVVLLAAAFIRLALNPAVLDYHPRSSTPVFNWYLYSYGIVTLCLFAGARLLAPPRERTLGINAAALLAVLGTVLAFLLVNIEIADFFSVPGSAVLTFQFSGNFGRDMTYTIAWALFALVLLVVSIWKHVRAGRQAALALLGVALLKLFLHDLARLEALYRIAALFAVAFIAILASYLYQRFLPGDEKHAPHSP
jgi:uncharacterized membrane protein